MSWHVQYTFSHDYYQIQRDGRLIDLSLGTKLLKALSSYLSWFESKNRNKIDANKLKLDVSYISLMYK